MSVILATAGYDHTIRFWEALSGICSRTIQHPDSQVNRLCISPCKRWLAAGGHHSVKIFDIKSTNPNPTTTFDGHTGNITGIAFHCEGKWMATSSEDGTVRIWDARQGNLQRTYSHGAAVNDVVIHPNQGEIVSCDRAGSIRVWDLAENQCSHELIPEEDVPVASVTVASDGSLLVAGNNVGNVYVWQLVTAFENTQLVPVTHFRAHSEYITRVLLSPDVKKLATCSSDHTAKIWEVRHPNQDPDRPQEQNGEQGRGEQPQATPEDQDKGKTVATSHSANVHERNNYTTSRNNMFYGSGTQVNGRGALVNAAAATNGTAPKPFPLEATLTGHQRWVWDCAFSADSAYLVTACSDHYARLWELHSQQIIRQYNGHHRGCVCVALNDYSDAR